jgi:subtilase family serine protease
LAPFVERPILSFVAGGAAGTVVVDGDTPATAAGIVVGETNAAVAGATAAAAAIVVGVVATADGQLAGAVISPEFEVL